MTPHHTRFLILEQGIGSALFNLLLNAAIAWALFRHLEVVPLWGQESIAGDTLGTCFFLPFFTALIVTPMVRRRIRRGALPELAWNRTSHPWLGWLPPGTLKRAAVLGGWTLIALGPLTLAILMIAAVNELRLAPFIAFKAGFAALLALLVTPVISLWALVLPVERAG
jgi:hypothetical protein